MTHPLIPQILDLAKPIAEQLELEVVDVIFHTNQNPPVLRLDIRNLKGDTGLKDCEKMSRLLEEHLDTTELISSAYVLEISSPGISRQLTTERDFLAFKGFEVLVKTYAPYEGNKEWRGHLKDRDQEAVYLTQKGRSITIPRNLIAKVQLDN